MKEAGLRHIQFWKNLYEKRVITTNVKQKR